MPNQNDQLDELKSLLFEEELDAFSKLEEKIDVLRLECNDIDTLVSKITPHLDAVLLKRLSMKNERTVEIYASYLTKMIEKSVEDDLAGISQTLQPVISPAIGKEIDENKEKMVDALYPIMGGMIAKYVSNAIQEMMEKINQKVEDGLSIESYQRKIKAKLSGVSESDLLLKESNSAMVRSLFIIDKRSSLLIAEAHVEDEAIEDPHMVASMASAIKDFINDWIANDKSESEVQLLSYGNETLYIESAGSVYLIAFLASQPDHEQRRQIQEFFANIVKNHSRFFQSFEGDDTSIEIVQINALMQDYLNKQLNTAAPKKQKSALPKYLFYALGMVLVIYLGFVSFKAYQCYQLENEIVKKSNETIDIDKSGDTFYLHGYIHHYKNAKIIEDVLVHKKIQYINETTFTTQAYTEQLSEIKGSRDD